MEISVTTDEELNLLDSQLRRLKIEYEIYFSNPNKRPPSDIEWKVFDLLRKIFRRRRPHEFLPALPVQRNGPALCHLQRSVAQEVPHPRRRLSPSAGRSTFGSGSSHHGRRSQAPPSGLWRESCRGSGRSRCRIVPAFHAPNCRQNRARASR